MSSRLWRHVGPTVGYAPCHNVRRSTSRVNLAEIASHVTTNEAARGARLLLPQLPRPAVLAPLTSSYSLRLTCLLTAWHGNTLQCVIQTAIALMQVSYVYIY